MNPNHFFKYLRQTYPYSLGPRLDLYYNIMKKSIYSLSNSNHGFIHVARKNNWKLFQTGLWSSYK